MTTDDPWPSRFHIAPAKLTAYLLNPHHRDGGPKSRFLMAFGFTPSDPDILAAALYAHTEHANFRCFVPAYRAVKLYFEGFLSAPAGAGPLVRTAWQIDDDEAGTTRFITLKPLPRP